VLARIRALGELAPLHNPAAVAGIEAVQEALPRVPQAACFDTAFHHTLPPAAATYALPVEWRERWELRRYGFHGINVEWCTQQAFERLAPGGAHRLVVCHLGSGCSVTAVLGGRSVDTTMGWTPLEGVPMATRAGSIDPGILLRAMTELSVGELADALNRDAGLLALAPGHADLHELFHAAAVGDVPARAAADVFVHAVAGAVATMTASLGGLDALVFTAGVGEGSALVRDEVSARVRHLGEDAEVLVIPASEERLIARQTAALLWPR
jgi:acetate kinase